MKTLSNNLKSASLLAMWAVIAAICLVAIFAGIGSAGVLSAVIMSTLMLMPLRNWCYRFIVWAIEFISSNNDAVRDWVNTWATMNPLIKDKERVQNVGFYRAIQAALWILFTILALIFWIFQGMSADIVYSFCHNAMTIFSNLAGTGWERASVLIWILTTFAYIGIVVWFFSTFFRGVFGGVRDVIILVVAWAIKRVLNYWLLGYTWSMIGSSLLGWLLVVVLPILFFIFVFPHLMRLLRTVFH